MARMPKTARKTFALEDTELKTWFERDRAHVDLQDRETGRTLIEFWDEDVEQLFEDGFLNRRDLHGSLYNYAVHLGAIKAPKPAGARAIARHHATKKKSPAQLNSEIAAALARKHGSAGSKTRHHATIAATGNGPGSKRVRKTKDIWVVQGNYGYHGWEDVTAAETWKEIKQNLREYRDNERGVPFRAIRRRERIVP